MKVSKNRGTPKSSLEIGFSIRNHPFWGSPMYGHHHIIIAKVTCITSIRQSSHEFHRSLPAGKTIGKHFFNL